MSQIFTLNAVLRTITGKQVADLREAGKLPAVIYGHKLANKNLTLDLVEFEKILQTAGESSLIDLKIGDQAPVKVLIQEVARHPVSHHPAHVDLYQVNMAEKVKTHLTLNFIGESPAVKNLAGVLIKAMDYIEIECLPGDLVAEIPVDLSKLNNLKEAIKVKDLPVPPAIHVLSEPEAVVVLVEEPTKIEEEKPVEVVVEPGVEGETAPVAEEETVVKEEEKIISKKEK